MQCVQSNTAEVLHGVLAGISVSPEALTREVIHLACLAHKHIFTHSDEAYFFTVVMIKLIATILNLPQPALKTDSSIS